MSGAAYLSSDDSALLRRAIRGRSGKSSLEIGAGNAGTLVELRRSFPVSAGTDLLRPGMADWKEVGADYLLADGASCFRDASFDLVAFNPPYLEGGDVDTTVDGGGGLHRPLSFLEEALRVVKPGGSVVFLLDGRADTEPFRKAARKSGFELERVDAERLFFEELVVYEARRASA